MNCDISINPLELAELVECDNKTPSVPITVSRLKHRFLLRCMAGDYKGKSMYLSDSSSVCYSFSLDLYDYRVM